jgi:hypothetical protein
VVITMATKKLIFEATPDSMTIEQDGIKGPACMKELSEYNAFMKEHGIDLAVTDQKKKPAFYQPAETSKTGSRVI